MTPEMIQKLRRSIVQHEQYRVYPYVDTVGKITIGLGYNLSDRGIDDEWINTQYQKDINFFYNQLSKFDWYQQLIPDRQIILIDMAFMGWKKFITFNKMIKAIEQGDYKQAAFEMLNSKWAEQVKNRATVLAHGMLTGVYEI
jgi:lysozyme